METVLHEVGSNVGWAAIMALAATLAAPALRQRPALIHGLWVLVLLKLVTPSLVHFAVGRHAAPATRAEAVIPDRANSPKAEIAAVPPTRKVAVPSLSSDTVPLPIRAEGQDRTRAWSWPWSWNWQTGLAWFWMAGVTAWWSLVGLQVYRFRQLLQATRPAPDDLRARTARLASHLGLRQIPSVWLTPAGVPPMVWAPLGPPRLLLPEQLWDQLDERQQDAILIHELAHLTRRDHWIRRLETVVIGLYWWNPVAWWARRQVEQAEEQCCDSWVLWALPGAADAYAEALVTTAVFLSGSRTPWPVRATGVGRIPPLRKRLNMILNNLQANSMARRAPRAALVLGIGSLLVLPGWVPGSPLEAEAPAVAQQGSAPTLPVVRQETTNPGVSPSPPRTGLQPPGSASAAEPKVAVSQPITREVTDYLGDFMGRVDSGQTVEIRARVSGNLINVFYKPEHTVDKGSPLFSIDPRPYQLELDKAEAELNRAEIQLKKRSMEFSSTEKLLKSRTVSQTEADLLEAARDESQASLRAAQATRDLARLNLEFTRIEAPIRGRISRPRLDPGNLVVANTTVLATIESSDPMYVYFNIPERTVLWLARARRDGQSRSSPISGLPVAIRLSDEQGYPHRARVDSQDIRVDPNTATLGCRAVLSNPDGILLPGLFAHVRLITSDPFKALLVADYAVSTTTSGQEHYLWLVNDQGVIDKRTVRVGNHYGGLQAVTEGLKENEWVVVSFKTTLSPGMKVKTEKIAMPNGPSR